MQTKALYILLIYIDADYKKDDFFTPTHVLYTCKCSFAMSTHVCNILLGGFDKKSGFDCCFLSAQCIERQARTSVDIETWVFTPFNVKWRSFLDKVVYCNNLRWSKVAFLEIEKAMYTVATPVPMFTIITPVRYTHSIQSKIFHAKFNLKVNYEKKCATAWLLGCTFASKSDSANKKMVWTHSNGVCMTVRYHNNFVKVDK